MTEEQWAEVEAEAGCTFLLEYVEEPFWFRVIITRGAAQCAFVQEGPQVALEYAWKCAARQMRLPSEVHPWLMGEHLVAATLKHGRVLVSRHGGRWYVSPLGATVPLVEVAP